MARHQFPLVLSSLIALTAAPALAVTTFVETFDTDDSNWVDEFSGTPTYFASGGVGDSGYISYTAPAFNSGAGGFGPPLKLMFRGNNADDASGDAFVGNWLADGVQTFSVAVRHNNTTPLNFYSRIASFGGAGASLSAGFIVAPNTWTTINVPIVNSNPPFSSFGSSSFAGVFSNVQNLQLGLYLPANTDFDDLRMDIDNVGVTVPEPTTIALAGLGSAMLLLRRRRQG
ncbi:MAG: PEP-CTERM sorting domain-containing protein [Verrucomicrobiota bacterium]